MFNKHITLDNPQQEDTIPYIVTLEGLFTQLCDTQGITDSEALHYHFPKGNSQGLLYGFYFFHFAGNDQCDGLA